MTDPFLLSLPSELERLELRGSELTRPSELTRFRTGTAESLSSLEGDGESQADLLWPTTPSSPVSVASPTSTPSSPASKAKPRQARSRPWRKPQAECLAEIAEADRILMEGPGAARAAGIDAPALLYCLLAQESLEEENSSSAAQLALDKLRQAATNGLSSEEVQEAKEAAAAALIAAGLEEPLCQRLPKNDVCHQVLPGLLLGAWAALSGDAGELRKRKVTHVVSIVSSEQQQMPAFIRGHLHIWANDKEDAAGKLADHFPEICRFIDAARNEPRGLVFVHCGAGISRAPTAAASYIMWKLGIPAALAIKLIRAARPCIRPNVGFVRQLRSWETQMTSLDGYASAANGGLLLDEGL